MPVWWGVWCCYYTFAASIGVKFDENILNIFKDFIREVSYIIPYKGICFISEKPEISWGGNFIHNSNDKAVKYKDGWGWYVLNGCVVPNWLVEKRDTEIDPQEVLKLNNAQQRAEGVKKIGIERFWHKCCKKVLDKVGEYELGLIPIDGTGKNLRPYLKMHNPSCPDVWHVEGCEPSCKTVQEALNWRNGTDLKPEILT
jgi:hypothetical protein